MTRDLSSRRPSWIRGPDLPVTTTGRRATALAALARASAAFMRALVTTLAASVRALARVWMVFLRCVSVLTTAFASPR